MIRDNKNFWEHDKLIKIDRIKPLNVLKKYKDDVISRARDLLECKFIYDIFNYLFIERQKFMGIKKTE